MNNYNYIHVREKLIRLNIYIRIYIQYIYIYTNVIPQHIKMIREGTCFSYTNSNNSLCLFISCNYQQH